MRIITVLLISAILFTSNIAIAGVKFIPEGGKLLINASGELSVLKSSDGKQEYFVLKIEDERLYILTGKLSPGLINLVGKHIEVKGLLKARIAFVDRMIPSIEVSSVKEIKQ